MAWAELKDDGNEFGLTYVRPEHVVAIEECVIKGTAATRIHLTTGHVFVMANPLKVVREIIANAEGKTTT